MPVALLWIGGGVLGLFAVKKTKDTVTDLAPAVIVGSLAIVGTSLILSARK